MPGQFRVGVTRDFLGPDGRIAFGDIGLSLLDRQPGLSWEFLAEDTPRVATRPGPRLRRPAGPGALA